MSEEQNVFTFSQNADFLLSCAVKCDRNGDIPGMLRYLRMARDAGSPKATALLAKKLTMLACPTASDRELYRLRKTGQMDAESYYIAACNALTLERFSLARAATNHYLELAPDGEWAENADQILSDYDATFFGPGARHSRSAAALDAIREALYAGTPAGAEKLCARIKEEPLRQTARGAIALATRQPEEAYSLLEKAVKADPANAYAGTLCALAAWRSHRPAETILYLVGCMPLLRSLPQLKLYCEVCLLCGQPGYIEDLFQGRKDELPYAADLLLYRLRAAEMTGNREEENALRLRLSQIDPEAEKNSDYRYTPEQVLLRTLILTDYHRDLRMNEPDGSEDDL